MHLESVLTGEGGRKDGEFSDTEMIEAARDCVNVQEIREEEPVMPR